MTYIILEFVLCAFIAVGIAALGFACSLVVIVVDEGIAYVLHVKSRGPSQVLQLSSIDIRPDLYAVQTLLIRRLFASETPAGPNFSV